MGSISIETSTILGDAESMDAVISEVRKGLMSKRKSLVLPRSLDGGVARRVADGHHQLARGESKGAMTTTVAPAMRAGWRWSVITEVLHSASRLSEAPGASQMVP